VSQNIDIQNNYEISIARCIHKDNTIRYQSNRYSLPLGTYNKYEKVCIKETETKELVISIPDTGEIIAKHSIPEGKG
ncbi:IS21 family transposase, partial [Priestia flexa]|nr:IS21 family transposase [Priestia flexa]